MDLRCKYTSKPCYNVRSLKDNGEYHNFCDFHRDKANQAQRRWYVRNATCDKERARRARKDPALRKRAISKIPDGHGGLQRPRKRAMTRKRGAVSFRDESVATTVLSGKLSASPSQPSIPSPPKPEYHGNTLRLWEPHHYLQPQSLAPDELSLPTDVVADAFKLDFYDWPVQVSISSPTDVDFVSLFAPMEPDDIYAGYIECVGRTLHV